MSISSLRAATSRPASNRLLGLTSQVNRVAYSQQRNTMKEVFVSKGPKAEIRDSPVPKPQPGQVLIKIEVSGSNPKDWKRPDLMDVTANHGDDIAGTVHELGSNTSGYGIKVGDRVAAFHEMMKPHGSFAEYGVAWAHTTFPIPDETSFEEGAALPLAALTSAVGLYARLRLPEPWLPASDDQKTPLVIYGGSSAVGSYAIQLARKSNIHPIIAVAGKAQSHVEGLIDRSKGDTIVDYRKGDDAVVSGIKDALQGQKLLHAFDAVSEKGSYQNITKVLESNGKITLVLPGKDYSEIPSSVQKSTTTVGDVHGPLKDFGYVYSRFLSRGLQEGWFKPQPQEAQEGGLAGVEGALKKLKEGKASAVKYVFRIKDTPGVGAT